MVIALSVSAFGWQAWQEQQRAASSENASDLYQAMLQSVSGAPGDAALAEQGMAIGEQLKADYDGSVYAQFAALHLARLAVERGDLTEAETQLRWVLGKADKGSDTAQLAQLRLARVLAASGDIDQALAILESGAQGAYQASYAMARGDILLARGRSDEARAAYTQALSLAGANPGQVNLAILQQKLQSLTPVPAREAGQSANVEILEEGVSAGRAVEEQ